MGSLPPGPWMTGAAAGHASEQEMQSAEFRGLVDVTLRNGGTLGELRETVSAARQAWEGRVG